MKKPLCPCLRSRVIEFLIRSAQLLEVSPIVKYSSLSLFADRFYPALSRLEDGTGTKNWLLHPVEESNLQLFALVSLWISSKIHDSPPFSVKNLKWLGDKFIKEQHYTKGDFSEAEMVFMQVLEFRIGVSNVAFALVEDLLVQLKVIATVGEHVKLEACMDVMDLLYEYEETSALYSSPQALSASIVAVAYVTTVPPQRWEFPILPWGEGSKSSGFISHKASLSLKFVTARKEEDILDIIRVILKHIFGPHSDHQMDKEESLGTCEQKGEISAGAPKDDKKINYGDSTTKYVEGLPSAYQKLSLQEDKISTRQLPDFDSVFL